MGRRGSVWGEGLAGDGWAQAARVDGWDLVHPDETLRVFPALVATASQSALLIGRLEEAVAVRWRRLRAQTGSHGRPLLSLDQTALIRLARAHEAAWFPPPGRLRSALVRLGTGTAPGAPGPGEEAVILALDDLLAALKAGDAVAYAEHRALSLAFHAGIHPAHVWSEALAEHECATAIGWLGVVARGRDALLPPDIALTLADSIVGSAEATGRPRDQRFGLCGLTPSQWGSIGQAARRCLAGKREIVRLEDAPRSAGLWKTARHHIPALPAGTVHRFVMGAVTATRAKRRVS